MTQEGTDDPTRPIDAAAAALLVANHRDFLAFLDRRVGDPVLAEEILLARGTIEGLSARNVLPGTVERVVAHGGPGQRQGLGGALIEHCQRKALEAGKPLTLQVLRNNPAVSLYKRYGFEAYAQNGPHKLLMRWIHRRS